MAARPPAIEGTCDRCGAGLRQRDDDRPAAVRVRMDAYLRSTAPLLDYYRPTHHLVEVPAEGTPAEICAPAREALRAAGGTAASS